MRFTLWALSTNLPGAFHRAARLAMPPRFNTFSAVVFSTILLISGCGGEHSGHVSGQTAIAEANDLAITEAWLQLPPRAAPVAAGYLQLQNRGSDKITLLSVASEQFGKVEMHETVMENDMMAMRELPKLVIPAGKTVVFKPGGLHLMLMQAKAPVDENGIYTATLQLETAAGEVFQLQLPLEKRHFGQAQDHSEH